MSALANLNLNPVEGSEIFFSRNTQETSQWVNFFLTKKKNYLFSDFCNPTFLFTFLQTAHEFTSCECGKLFFSLFCKKKIRFHNGIPCLQIQLYSSSWYNILINIPLNLWYPTSLISPSPSIFFSLPNDLHKMLLVKELSLLCDTRSRKKTLHFSIRWMSTGEIENLKWFFFLSYSFLSSGGSI